MAETVQNPVASQALSPAERAQLLQLARRALEDGVCGRPLLPLDLSELSSRLSQPGASFVTLTAAGELRGCVGGLEPIMALAEDVRLHAVSAALEDYRFPPVQPAELADLQVEISCLTPAQPLEYGDAGDLLARLRPNTDGVVLKEGLRRATFLPQVWEKVPDPDKFLSLLCRKMGAPPDLWRRKHLDVLVYQVEEFHE
jgi:AmmeMemoRadiSam system protein A